MPSYESVPRRLLLFPAPSKHAERRRIARGKGPHVRAHGCASSDRPAPCQTRRASARSADVRQARMVLPNFAVTKVGRRRRKLLLCEAGRCGSCNTNGFADFCRNKSRTPKAEAFAFARPDDAAHATRMVLPTFAVTKVDRRRRMLLLLALHRETKWQPQAEAFNLALFPRTIPAAAPARNCAGARGTAHARAAPAGARRCCSPCGDRTGIAGGTHAVPA